MGAIVSLLSGLLFGLIPVARHAGPHIARELRGGGRTSSQSRERHRARSTLVVVQVALALVLLVASGLMIRTFQALRAVQPGFTQPDQLQLVRLTIPGTQVGDPERVLRMQTDIRDRIAAIPGVSAASFASSAPMEPGSIDNLLLVEHQTYAEGQIPPDRRFKFVSPGFFQTIGISLVAGRDLTWADLHDRRPVAVISENLAREVWREPAAALGKRIRENAADPWRFTLDASGRAASGVSGARSESLMLDTSTPFSVIAVHFRPGGGFPFFGGPSTELRNQSVALDLLWGRYAAGVRDRLWEAKTSEERFKLLEETLLTRAGGRFDRNAAVRHALDVFDRSNGVRPVGDVIQRIGLSPRRFGELFRSEVGLSPKAFCRIRRFNEVLKRIERLTDVDWADVALFCGYFDQAHFNHDFRAFAGLTPSAYLRYRMSRTHVVEPLAMTIQAV